MRLQTAGQCVHRWLVYSSPNKGQVKIQYCKCKHPGCGATCKKTVRLDVIYTDSPSVQVRAGI